MLQIYYFGACYQFTILSLKYYNPLKNSSKYQMSIKYLFLFIKLLIYNNCGAISFNCCIHVQLIIYVHEHVVEIANLFEKLKCNYTS
jgi:hypothetical protein